MDRYSTDLQALINEHGVSVRRTPDSVMQAQLQAWDTVVEQLGQDEFFKRVVDSQRAWGERVGFYMHLNQADYRLAYEHYFPGKLPS